MPTPINKGVGIFLFQPKLRWQLSYSQHKANAGSYTRNRGYRKKIHKTRSGKTRHTQNQYPKQHFSQLRSFVQIFGQNQQQGRKS